MEVSGVFGIVRQIRNEFILATLGGNGGTLLSIVFAFDIVNRFLGKRKLARKLERRALSTSTARSETK